MLDANVVEASPLVGASDNRYVVAVQHSSGRRGLAVDRAAYNLDASEGFAVGQDDLAGEGGAVESAPRGIQRDSGRRRHSHFRWQVRVRLNTPE